MSKSMNRRQFLAVSAGVGTGLCWSMATKAVAQTTSPTCKVGMKKALIVSKPTSEKLTELKAAGFDGVEAGIVPVDVAESCRKAAEKLDMKIHSVLRGWAQFNAPDANVVADSIATTEKALLAAQGLRR